MVAALGSSGAVAQKSSPGAAPASASSPAASPETASPASASPATAGSTSASPPTTSPATAKAAGAAQKSPEAANAPSANPLSAQCAVPSAEIATPAPLPATIARLEANQPLRILAIGSSSTWGVGATSRRKNYPSQLENLLGKVLKGVDVDVVNRGVSGETADITADRLLLEAALLKPDLVLWQVGTNDAVQRVPADDFERTVRNTVSTLRASKIDVVLVGLQYTPKYERDEHYFAIRNALRRVAADQNVLYVRRYQAMEYISHTKANLKMMADDDFHLNDLGYQCMAEHIAHAMTANIFVRRRKPAS